MEIGLLNFRMEKLFRQQFGGSMFKMNRHFAKVVVLALVIALFWGCANDAMNPVSTERAAKNQIVEQHSTGTRQDMPAEKRGNSPIGWVIGTTHALIAPLLGGTLQIGSSRLQIPPFAVLLPTFVTFTIIDNAPPDMPGALSRQYFFTPHGLNFLTPSTLYVSFQDAGLGNRNPYKYRFYYFNQDENRWDPQPTTVDMANQRYIVTMAHFSRYAFGR